MSELLTSTARTGNPVSLTLRNQRDAIVWIQQTTWEKLRRCEVPEAVQRQHPMYFAVSVADDPIKHGFTVCCRCGWIRRFELYDLTTTTPELLEALDQHAQEIIDTFRPTLREMTEWGWFQPEPDDPDPLYPVHYVGLWALQDQELWAPRRLETQPSVRWIQGWPANPS